jgi:hypothetical protein
VVDACVHERRKTSSDVSLNELELSRKNEMSDPNLPTLDPPSLPAGPQAVNPRSLGLEQLAKMLSSVGGKQITVEQLQADIDAGAPQLSDGNVNLIHYAAWLAREVQGH